MTADIRMGLENELDQLDESGVESWLARCFEACDPRYDSDWLNGTPIQYAMPNLSADDRELFLTGMSW